MSRRPPRSTRTDTLLPYTTLFRSSTVRNITVFDYFKTKGAANIVFAGLFPGATPVYALPSSVLDSVGLGTLLRSEEHTSELQSLMRISYAVFCLKKKNKIINKLMNHSIIKTIHVDKEINEDN